MEAVVHGHQHTSIATLANEVLVQAVHLEHTFCSKGGGKCVNVGQGCGVVLPL